MRQRRSWTIPEGGSGRLTDALVAALQAAGGEVVCGQEVVELVLRDGRCAGVVTATGDRFLARDAVVSSVHVRHLVDMAPTVDVLSSNTLRLTLTGMGCGGSEVVVDGDNKFIPGTILDPTLDCHVDDTHDCGSMAVFKLTISDPTPGEIVPTIPTPVMGEVCHGLPIAQVSINDKPLDVSTQSFMGSGLECAGGTYEYTIDTTIPQTDLFAEAVGATTALFAERPTPETLSAAIERHRPTVVTNVPTMMSKLLEYDAARTAEGKAPLDLSSVRCAVSAGEALPPAVFARFRDRFRIDILDGVGSTEVLHTFIANRPGRVAKVTDPSGGELFVVPVRARGLGIA